MACNVIVDMLFMGCKATELMGARHVFGYHGAHWWDSYHKVVSEVVIEVLREYTVTSKVEHYWSSCMLNQFLEHRQSHCCTALLGHSDSRVWTRLVSLMLNKWVGTCSLLTACCGALPLAFQLHLLWVQCCCIPGYCSGSLKWWWWAVLVSNNEVLPLTGHGCLLEERTCA